MDAALFFLAGYAGPSSARNIAAAESEAFPSVGRVVVFIGFVVSADKEKLKQERVAKTVWHWQDEGFSETGLQSVSDIRKQAGWQIIFIALLASFFFYFDVRVVFYVLCVSGTVIAFAALFSPFGLYSLIERAAGGVVILLSKVIQAIVFPIVYFGFFVPYGLLRRRGKP